MNALNLISSSLRILGVLASGETASSTEASDALSVLNDLIDSWSNEQLLIPNKVREVFSLVANQQSYTMGSGGNFNTARAMRIENALIQLSLNTPVVELPLEILTKEVYALQILKTLPLTYPLYIYPDGAYPLETLSLWPVPNTSDNSLVLYSWKPLSTLAALTTSISLPQGYQRALRFSLAIDLSLEYGKSLPEAALGIAIESKAAIKRMNTKPRFLKVDPALVSSPSVWNWRTGGFK